MKLHRRHFLALGAASMGGVFISRWAIGQNQSAQSVTHYPDLYKSVNGLLEIDLEAGNHSLRVGEGANRAATQRQASLMAYNGQVPAPRLEAKPGDTVRIHFANKLAQPTSLHYEVDPKNWTGS